MTNKMYEIIVAVITGSLARPLFEDIKEYTVSVEAASPEEAEKKAMNTIAADSAKFDPTQHRIRIAEIKAVDGSAVVYKDDDQTYRKLARALRAYRMWPYLERCKEFAVDYCVYAGVSVEEAAKMVAADPDVASSPAREARGNQLTIAQQMLAEVKRQNAIRIERAQQPKTETEKSAPAENKDPLYPEAGAERYHRMDPEVAKELAKQGRPEQVIQIDDNFERQDFYNFHKEEDEMMYEKIEDILNNVLADIELGSCHHIVITGDNGQLNLVKTEKAIEFGRTLYARCGEIFNEEHTAEIRKGLEELFGSSKDEHKTEDQPNEYDDLAAEKATAQEKKKLDLTLSLIYKGKDVPVKRQIVVYDKGNNFYPGIVLNGTKKVGTFYWNTNHVKPVFKPEAAPIDMGVVNKMRYVSAIKKALEDAGIKGKQQSLFKDVPFNGEASH